MALSNGHKANFNTIKKASEQGDLALMEARRKADGAVVALVCAHYVDAEGMHNLVPLALMLEGNPYEDF